MTNSHRFLRSEVIIKDCIHEGVYELQSTESEDEMEEETAN
jgi:hypothetical protein